jgi:AcrR family transcriptional regulator
LSLDTTQDTRPEQEQPVDGRTARGQRTRSSVVDALLALQEEGDLSPTAQQVAARAGVALRTVFGHFSDMETLWAEAGQRELAKLEGLAEVIDPDLPLAERIDRFSASRGRVLEALMPVMRAARLREPSSPQLLKNRELYNKVGDDEVLQVFARELGRLDETTRARTLDALYLCSAAAAWEALRHDRALSPEQAVQVVRRSVAAVLST